jgi:hypothetical protein
MYSRSRNQLMVVSSALAAGGVLACAAALLDALLPKESLAAFLANVALLGLVVTGVMVGFTWVCDKFESHFDGRLDRILGTATIDRNAGCGPKAGVCRPELKLKIPLDKEQDLWTRQYGCRP